MTDDNKIETQEVAVDKIRAIFGNTVEMYNFLTTEVGYHLPPKDFTNARWLHLIWMGKLPVR